MITEQRVFVTSFTLTAKCDRNAIDLPFVCKIILPKLFERREVVNTSVIHVQLNELLKDIIINAQESFLKGDVLGTSCISSYPQHYGCL